MLDATGAVVDNNTAPSSLLQESRLTDHYHRDYEGFFQDGQFYLLVRYVCPLGWPH